MAMVAVLMPIKPDRPEKKSSAIFKFSLDKACILYILFMYSM